MTPFVSPFRSILAAALLAGVISPALLAQATKPASNQGPYQPQAQASPFNGTVVEDVVARVNDQIITRSDYQRALQQMEADAHQQGISDQELEAHKRDLLRDLIDKELLLSKGKELGITGETELVKRLDEIRKQNHLDSMEDLEKAAQQQGVSYEDFKANIRNEIISQQVIRDQVSRHIQLTKADIDNYYRTHKSEFDQPEQVHLASILIPVDGEDAASMAKAQDKAAKVESELKSGASFEDLAKKDSSGPTAATGGDLGDFKRGALAKPIEDAVFALQNGQVTAPIRTKQGLLILKVTQHTGGASQDFTSIEPQVEEAAYMSRMQPQLRAYLSTLREQAYVDVRPGYSDSAATSNAVKPNILYSAYTAPGAKKDKPKVQRARFRETGHPLKRNTATTTQQPSAKPSGTTTGAAAASTSTRIATNTPPTAPVKKQKVRYGQVPRGTLDTATDAAAPTQVASNVNSNITVPGQEPSAAAAPKARTRFSDRARHPKVKGPTQDQLENESQGKATAEETATQQTQAAPLGLNGDTLTKKKQPKDKAEGKTRYADKDKDKQETPSNTPPPASNADTQPPLSTSPAPGASPTPPASPSTPQTGPQ